MMFIQKEIIIKAKARGFHLITDEIISKFPELTRVKCGIANIFIQHTSASLSINENADPTVRSDMETYFNRSVPEDTSLYQHIYEGSDDMTSHIKNAIIGTGLNIPVRNGEFALGTWQGIYLCEHRNRASSRKIIITIIGE